MVPLKHLTVTTRQHDNGITIHVDGTNSRKCSIRILKTFYEWTKMYVGFTSFVVFRPGND